MEDRSISRENIEGLIQNYWDNGKLSENNPEKSSEKKLNMIIQDLIEETAYTGDLEKTELVRFFEERGYTLKLDPKEMDTLTEVINRESLPTIGVSSENVSIGAIAEDLIISPFEYKVDTKTKAMKNLDQYRKTDSDNLQKTKLSKVKQKAWEKLPQVKIGKKEIIPGYDSGLLKLQESIFGTEEELKGVKRSPLEDDYIRELMVKRDEINEKYIKPLVKKSSQLTNKVDDLKREAIKEDSKGAKKDQDLIDKLRAEIDSLEQEISRLLDERNGALKNIVKINQFLEKLLDKETRTNEIIEQFLDPSELGAKLFMLTLPLTSSIEDGVVQVYCIGSKGEEFNPERKTVLICSGSGDRAENYSLPVVEELKKEGYQTVVFNYMGFGESRGEMSEWGLFASAEAVYQFLTSDAGQRIPEENIILYGYSLGGYVIAEAAANHPDISAAIFDRCYTSGLDVAESVSGKGMGKITKRFMKDHFGELNTEKKFPDFGPKTKIAIFEAEKEAKTIKAAFGQKAKKGKVKLKKRFHKILSEENYHVITGADHFHPTTGIWFSEDQPQTNHEARDAFFDFLDAVSSS